MSLSDWFKKTFIGTVTGTWEKPSPSDIVKVEKITHADWKVTIDLTGALPITQKPVIWYPHIPDTGSMDSVMDFGHNALYVWASNKDDERALLEWLWNQEVGNIIAYRLSDAIYYAHRIIKKGIDSSGRYYFTKGDNNPIPDTWKVREGHIKYVCIGIIY